MSNEIDFDAALEPLAPKNTARLTLFGVKVNSKKDVVLIGVHAGDLNDRHQSLVTKLTAKHTRELAAEDSPERRALVNRLFRQVFGVAVVTGWENVCAKDGTPAPFTAEAFGAFVAALAKRRPDLADAARVGGCAIDSFFKNPTNFADGYDEAAAEALGEG